MRDFNAYYRPKTFGEMLGNHITTSIISKEIATGKLPNAYILVAPPGNGKTTLGRIIARELGVETPIEINAAVNNGVEDVRAINEDASYMSFDGKRKVYLIDEAQAMTKAAFQASLKLMEEPPEEVLFILCTTDLNKIPAAIRSRAQVFYLSEVSPDEIAERLGIICNDLDIEFEPEALEYIAKGCMGCIREAIQKLEQVSILGEVTLESVKKVLPDLDIFRDILVNHNFSRVQGLTYTSVSIDSLIKEAVNLAIDNEIPRKVAIGLVKLRPVLNTPFDPQVVQLYLEEAYNAHQS